MKHGPKQQSFPLLSQTNANTFDSINIKGLSIVPTEKRPPEIKHTFGHVDCPACDITREEIMGHDPDSLARLRFSDAAPLWLETRKRVLEPITHYGYKHHIDNLNKFFRDITLVKVNLAHLRMYQRMRQSNFCEHNVPLGKGCVSGCSGGLWHRTGASSLINHELSVVQQILKRAGQWERFHGHYEPLPPPRFQPPKVMTDAEEDRFFAIAESNPDWQFAGWIGMLTGNTTASGKELRQLRLHHVQLEARPPRLFIPDGKNGYRIRTIALNQTACNILVQCLKRARLLGATKPDHHLFPVRVKRNSWDVTRPASASWLRHSWTELREAAGLSWLTPHCLRHQCITRMAESGVPPEIIRATAGHVSEQMMRHYCHTRLHVQHEYLASIDPLQRKRVQSDRLGASRIMSAG